MNNFLSETRNQIFFYTIGALFLILLNSIIILCPKNLIEFFQLFDLEHFFIFEYASKILIIWLFPALIIELLTKKKLFYSVGLNYDTYSFRDIF